MFKKINVDKIWEYSLVLGYFASYVSAVCFFYDTRKIYLLGHLIQFPVGLTFYPLTFACTTIFQDRLGKENAATLVILGFIFTNLLVYSSFFLALLGERMDYVTVFKDITVVMGASWVIVTVSSSFNILFYAYLQKTPPRNNFVKIARFFVTITLTEALISFMSVPLLFYRHGLEGNSYITWLVLVAYKVVANLLITSIYSLFSRVPR